MDVAKNFASWRDRSPEQWIAKANQVLPPIVVALLIVVIAYQAASLTRRLLEAPGEPSAVPVAPPPSTGPSRIATNSYEPLHGWKPFGEPPAPGARLEQELTDLENLPTTTLPLELWGTNGANRNEAAMATISSQGRGARQFTYFVGDTIDNANGATLYAVQPTQVVIELPGGRREVLPLPNADELAARPGAGVPRLTGQTTQGPPPGLNRAVQTQEALNNLTAAAAALQDKVRMTPAVENGDWIGMRLNPGNEPEIFAELGFEPGDILMQVNGVALNDQNAARAMAALTESTQAQATILRNGQQQTLIVDLTTIQRMMESQQ